MAGVARCLAKARRLTRHCSRRNGRSLRSLSRSPLNGSIVSQTGAMESQDYPIRHFDQMGRFATALKALPAQVLDHSYSYESFGSWTVTIRYKGWPLRLVFDGRDQEFCLERSTGHKPPYVWSLVWRGSGATVMDPCDEPIIRAIRDASSAG